MESVILKKVSMTALLVSLMTLSLSFNVARASSEAQETSAFLQEFKVDPYKAMNERLPKRDGEGRVIDHIETHFTADAIKTGAFIDAKDEVRKNMCTLVNGYRVCLKDYLPGKSPFADTDRVENLVELPSIIRNPMDMEKQGLLKATVPKLPWSDSYWPMNKGLIAIRYNDPAFPNSGDWMTNYNYVRANPAASIFAVSDGDNLSPAEKYDYLVGDTSYSLTAASWARGKAVYDTWKMVENWDGICDGWSAASVTYDEPLHVIYATASNGRQIPFYPSDVKGLASLLWATGNNPTRFIGTRCTVKSPQRDDIGRTMDPGCQDSNPGTFHMALVNQLGVAKRPFIMDATYDYEIWNYPVWTYNYSYFNPRTLMPVNNWRDALVPYGDWHTDRFADHRAADTKYVIGISMFVTYMVELMPTHLEGSHKEPRTAHYIYDLELDGNKNIIGGEWYTTTQHPDFIWTPPAGARGMSAADAHLLDNTAWPAGNPFPEDWTQPALLASSQAQPLGVVVQQLVNQSSK